jgi:hypothetical protein
MIIQRGDREIAGALMAGVIAGKAEAIKDSPGVAAGEAEVDRATRTSSVSAEGAATFPIGEGFWKGDGKNADSLEVYSVQEDKWRRVARQVHVAIGNTKTPEDYCQLIVKARGDYAIHTRSGPLHAFAGKLLLAWALIWQGIWGAYDAQDRVLRP